MVKCVLPLILVLTAGCAITPPSISPAMPVTVKVPVEVPVYCEAPPLAHPQLPIARLNAASPAADTIRSWAATVVLLKGAVEERDAVIAGCVRPEATVGPVASNPRGPAPSGATLRHN
jgi:hypothetical protein